MERVVRERMTTQDVEAITPQSLINIRPVVAALKEFFGTSQLSQFMDQTNPIAGPDAQASPLRARSRWSVPRPRRHGGPRRPPVALRPDVPDRDPGRPQHRPDRLAGLLRPDQPVRLRRDAVPQGQEGQGHRPGRLPHRRRRGPLRHRAGQRRARRQGPLRRGAGPGPPAARRGRRDPGRRGRLHGRLAAPDGVGRDRPDPVPRARRRQPRAHGRQHAAPGRAAHQERLAAGRHRHGVPRRGRRR